MNVAAGRNTAHLASLTLEAMRLGVVPRADLTTYTVGRDDELAIVDQDLGQTKAQGGAIRAFLGEYGAGKTHLLELIREYALAQNFLTARVVLNPEETAPSHPKRVYRELVRSLEYPDLPTAFGQGLRPLLQKAAEDDETLQRFCVTTNERSRDLLDEGAHLYLTPALRYFRALTLGDKAGRRSKKELLDEERDYGLTLLFNWLEGHPTISNQEIDDDLRQLVGRQGRIFSMKDFRPWARIYGYLLSGIAALAKSVGYAGLVVLVDEAEFYSLLSAQNREYAQILFKALAWASVGGDSELLPFSAKELELGGMGILQDLPPRYGAESGLYTVFAMTPNEEGIAALQAAVPHSQIVELTRLDLDDYKALVSRVAAHYRDARQQSPLPQALEGALGRFVAGLLHSGYIDSPRQAMKFIVEFLDLATFRPDDMKQVIADLRQIYGG